VVVERHDLRAGEESADATLCRRAVDNRDRTAFEIGLRPGGTLLDDRQRERRLEVGFTQPGDEFALRRRGQLGNHDVDGAALEETPPPQRRRARDELIQRANARGMLVQKAL
jgi:hypothetical protein